MLDAKLQIRPGETVALVDTPFAPSLEAARAESESASAVLVFVRDRIALDARGGLLREVAERGGLAWVAYPKGRALGTDLDRDAIHAWAEGRGLKTVRQVAVDGTWSAMRLKAR